MGWDSNNSIAFCTHSCSHSSPVVLHFFIHSGQSYKYGHARPATNSQQAWGWGCISLSLPGLGKKCNYCCYVLTPMWIAHLPLACCQPWSFINPVGILLTPWSSIVKTERSSDQEKNTLEVEKTWPMPKTRATHGPRPRCTNPRGQEKKN